MIQLTFFVQRTWYNKVYILGLLPRIMSHNISRTGHYIPGILVNIDIEKGQAKQRPSIDYSRHFP